MNSLQDEVLTAIHSVWNRRWLALAVAWGVCLVGWLIVALIPNSYESKARIFVQLDDALAGCRPAPVLCRNLPTKPIRPA